MTPMTRWRFFMTLVLALAADLWTKAWAERTLGTLGSLEVIPGCLRFQNSLNKGSAFSLFEGQQALFVGIGIITVAVIAYYLMRAEGRGVGAQVVLGLLGAGVLGNLHDRLFHPAQAVRDFIDMYIGTHHWPTYNLADVYIVLGAAAIFVASFRKPAQRARGPEPERGDA